MNQTNIITDESLSPFEEPLASSVGQHSMSATEPRADAAWISRACDSHLEKPTQVEDFQGHGAIPKLSATTAFALGRKQASRDLISSIPLWFVDLFAIGIALAAASFIAWLLGIQPALSQPLFALGTIVMTALAQYVHGLYPACGLTYSLEYRRILRTSLFVITALGFALLLRPTDRFPLIEFLAFAAVYVFMLSSSRAIARHILARYDWWTQPVIIVGNHLHAASLYHRLNRSRHEGLRPQGVLFDPQHHWTLNDVTNNGIYIGPVCEMDSILLKTGTCRLAVADTDLLNGDNFHLLNGIPHVTLPTELGNRPSEKARLTEHEGKIELHCQSKLTCPASLAAKRFLDLALVVMTAPAWIPLMAIIGLLIKVCDPGPVFYRQNRVGRFRAPFRAIKFRSMVCNADQKLKSYLTEHPELQAEWQLTHKLKCDPRVTSIGDFLRRTSLDELPQLWNVLVGEMSLVGPRPIIDCNDYDREYIEGHPEVFELYQMVRPGITGLWQVSGRNKTRYIDRVNFDRSYLNNWSVMLDIFILWRTLKTAILREGAC